MTEKSVWTSEQQALTSIWMRTSEAKNILIIRDQVQNSDTRRRRWRYRVRGAGYLMRLCWRVDKSPLPSVLLENLQSRENKLDELCLRLPYQNALKNCNILCFSESWLNKDMVNINLAGFSIHRLDRTTAAEKLRWGGVWLFVKNNWGMISNIRKSQGFASLR